MEEHAGCMGEIRNAERFFFWKPSRDETISETCCRWKRI